MPDAQKQLRVGVVGTGSLGFHHARILRDIPDVKMEGFFESRPERAQEVTEELGIDSRKSLADLLDRVDAVVIAVPTVEHESVATAALARGIHVMVEKPMAPDLEAADRILAAAEGTGAVVQIGHVERFNSAIQAAEEYLENPLFIESHRIAPFVPRGTDVAVVLDLLFSGRRKRLLYKVMHLGERFDLWLNLHGALTRGEATGDGLFGGSRAGSETMVGKLEQLVRGGDEPRKTRRQRDLGDFDLDP